MPLTNRKFAKYEEVIEEKEKYFLANCPKVRKAS